jgi:hypothetical protein
LVFLGFGTKFAKARIEFKLLKVKPFSNKRKLFERRRNGSEFFKKRKDEESYGSSNVRE